MERLQKIFGRLGFALLLIGAAGADSDSLWIPAVLIFGGLALMILDRKEINDAR